MTDALIGHSGFVGTTLLRQRDFEGKFRSTNIHEIDGSSFSLVVCAGAPAQKWIANKNPQEDQAKISGLIERLQTISSEKFVLISTVDVFGDPRGVTEESPVDESDLHAYGLHRRQLEKFVESHFPDSLIIRLPGLVGPGLRKNVIYDFLNDNNLDRINSEAEFQFYPMVNLWNDIEALLKTNLKLVHLTAEPVQVETVARTGFGRVFNNQLDAIPPRYDMQTIHSEVLGSQGKYHYSARESLLAIRAFAQSEPRATGER